jgi:hypothetical protein
MKLVMSAPQRVATALRRFAEENGVPNGVSPGELADTYTSLPAFRIGAVIARNRTELDNALARAGYRITSYDGPHEGYGKRIGIDAA